jgi:DNA invertase Pin-like site-specific DNA recombinase
LKRIKKGQKYVVGKRKEFLAGSFDVQEKTVQVLTRDGKDIISTRPEADYDELEQAPLF